MADKITEQELEAWGYIRSRLVDILNGDYDVETAAQDIKSFRNTEYYTGDDERFKEVLDE